MWPLDLGIIILCTYVHSVAHLIQVKGIEIKRKDVLLQQFFEDAVLI